MKKVLLSTILLVTLAGCSSISNAPAVTKAGKDGSYFTIINKHTSFLNIPISYENEVLKCNIKNSSCEKVELRSKDGQRFN